MPVSVTTVRTWLRGAGLAPTGKPRGMTWREFVRTQQHSVLLADFFTVETIRLQRFALINLENMLLTRTQNVLDSLVLEA